MVLTRIQSGMTLIVRIAAEHVAVTAADIERFHAAGVPLFKVDEAGQLLLAHGDRYHVAEASCMRWLAAGVTPPVRSAR